MEIRVSDRYETELPMYLKVHKVDEEHRNASIDQCRIDLRSMELQIPVDISVFVSQSDVS